MLRRLGLLQKQIKFAEAHVIQSGPTKVGLESSPLNYRFFVACTKEGILKTYAIEQWACPIYKTDSSSKQKTKQTKNNRSRFCTELVF